MVFSIDLRLKQAARRRFRERYAVAGAVPLLAIPWVLYFFFWDFFSFLSIYAKELAGQGDLIVKRQAKQPETLSDPWTARSPAGMEAFLPGDTRYAFASCNSQESRPRRYLIHSPGFCRIRSFRILPLSMLSELLCGHVGQINCLHNKIAFCIFCSGPISNIDIHVYIVYPRGTFPTTHPDN